MKKVNFFALAIVALLSVLVSTASAAVRELSEVEMKRVCFSSPLNTYENQGDQNYLEDKIREMNDDFELMDKGSVKVAYNGYDYNPYKGKTHYTDKGGTYHFDNPAITSTGHWVHAKYGSVWFGPVTVKNSGTLRITTN